MGAVAADAMRTVSSIMRLLVALLGFFLSLLRHMAFMDTLAALGWSIGATGAGAASHFTRQGAGTAGSSASKSGEKENCPGTIESRLSAIQRGI